MLMSGVFTHFVVPDEIAAAMRKRIQRQQERNHLGITVRLKDNSFHKMCKQIGLAPYEGPQEATNGS